MTFSPGETVLQLVLFVANIIMIIVNGANGQLGLVIFNTIVATLLFAMLFSSLLERADRRT